MVWLGDIVRRLWLSADFRDKVSRCPYLTQVLNVLVVLVEHSISLCQQFRYSDACDRSMERRSLISH